MSDLIDKLNNINKIQKASIRALLQGLPQYQKKTSIHQYEKQLVETRTMIYHKQTRRLLQREGMSDPEARKAFVISRVARELWTNFCIQGEETAMLAHLQKELCRIFDAKLHFLYIPGGIELAISKEEGDQIVPLTRDEHYAVINKAWEICQEVVASYIT